MSRAKGFVVWFALLVGAVAFAQSPLRNPSFEDGEPGAPPPGWLVGNTQAYAGEIVADSCRAGKQCAMLRASGAAAPAGIGTFLQSFGAAPYRGKKFRYRAAVRTEGAGPQNRRQLWIRVDLEGGGMGFFDNMSDRPINAGEWTYYDISGDVDRNAASISLGLLMSGAGRTWIDDVSFEITGDADPIEPARPLTSRGLDNVQALARLFGYVRYFHPSDEAAAADWNRLAMESVRAVEPAMSPAELAARLTSVFGPIAPAIRVFPTGTTPPPLDVKPTPQIIMWQHRGVGLNPQNVYRSARVIRPASEARDALQPFRADLPGGVTCLIPIALYRDSAAPAPAGPTPARPGGTANDRATRLAAVVVAWNVLQHFYPYFDVAGTDWSDTLRTTLAAAAEDVNADAFSITLRRMVAALHDGHGRVAGPGIQAPYVPPVIWTSVEGRVVALSSDGSTSVNPGDAIVSVDGKPIAEVLAANEALISGATPQWIRYRAVSELLARKPGDSIQLELDSLGVRRTVTLKVGTPISQLQEPRPDKVKEIEPGIFYLDLNRITDADYASALPSLVKSKGIVFDMRGYPGNIQNVAEFFGHLIDRPATSAQWHIPQVTRPDREGLTFTRGGEWQLQPKAPYLTAKRAFVIDGRAISYAESCMGIVEYYKLGEIVGEPTAGTNGNVNPFTVPGGYNITWTGMKVLKHDGSRHHGIGILPTIPVSRTRAGIAAGRDEMLERAVQAVRP